MKVLISLKLLKEKNSDYYTWMQFLLEHVQALNSTFETITEYLSIGTASSVVLQERQKLKFHVYNTWPEP